MAVIVQAVRAALSASTRRSVHLLAHARRASVLREGGCKCNICYIFIRAYLSAPNEQRWPPDARGTVQNGKISRMHTNLNCGDSVGPHKDGSSSSEGQTKIVIKMPWRQ